MDVPELLHRLPVNRACRKNIRLDFYFVGLIFVVPQLTVKTAKIGSNENFWLYGMPIICENTVGIAKVHR